MGFLLPIYCENPATYTYIKNDIAFWEKCFTVSFPAAFFIKLAAIMNIFTSNVVLQFLSKDYSIKLYDI